MSMARQGSDFSSMYKGMVVLLTDIYRGKSKPLTGLSLMLGLFLSMLLVLPAAAQSGLDARQFNKYWRVESEASDYQVTFSGDTCELVAPKGLTLWRKEKLRADCAVEYDVQVVVESPSPTVGGRRDSDRLSDMNCFWLASDPNARDIWKRAGWRSGIFTRCYTLQMYYLGYGGNYNTTTRFRRYTGDERGVDSTAFRPSILTEYTDSAHLLRPNHWYHIRLQTLGGRTQMYVDGECIVDYLDPDPLAEGWFGFRTTLSHTRITHFHYEKIASASISKGIPLHWVGLPDSLLQGDSSRLLPVTFGIPFAPGELQEATNTEIFDSWVNARWPDGSVKWVGIATLASPTDNQLIQLNHRKCKEQHGMGVRQTDSQMMVNTGRLQAYIALKGNHLIDSLVLDGVRVGGCATLVASDGQGELTSLIDTVVLEREGNVSAVVKIEGRHQAADRRLWLPFTLRLYFWKDCEQVKLVHTFIYDGDEQHDFISSLGIRFCVPMRLEPYNRHIAFATDDKGVWTEPVQPLTGRRWLSDPQAEQKQLRGERITAYSDMNNSDRHLVDSWASWDAFRLSQLTDNSFSIRKRATTLSSEHTSLEGQGASVPWIGTFTGRRAQGYVFVGDTQGGLGVYMKDFWQSYPSTILVENARSDEAELTMFMWSPEAEPMNLCHYDTIAHGLDASYEDVQSGLSSPYGIGRTTTLWISPQPGYPGRERFSEQACLFTADAHLLPSPEYLHQKRAFGMWSLHRDDSEIEDRLSDYLDFYSNAVEQHKWYGFWNYGDLMHAYDPLRHSWQYDVGGYAWDNTELATPMWLWYSFLRTGRADVWRMAEAMTRHNSEVDTYHIGPLAPLGSRHNVSHWGCGAKEARISQAAFLRFYYYLSGGDERTGDLMHAQADCDTLLYHLDPMRLAEPRELYPCTAPARLRFGPDWLAYAGNWLTEWERTGNTFYRDKIVAGLESLTQLRNGLFTGNKALGYDPATGRISYEGNPDRLSTNHLATIMGGFEVMNELFTQLENLSATKEAGKGSFHLQSFRNLWLDYALRYKQMAWDVSHNRFPVRRLMAYAAWQSRSPQLAAEAWHDLWHRIEHAEAPQFSIRQVLPPAVPTAVDEWQGLTTNDAALWSLDAIYMLETIGLSPTPPSDVP